jgi:hypothetical protein
VKSLVNGEFKVSSFMRLTLSWALLFLVGLWTTNFLLFFQKMGLSPEAVVGYYLGSEAQFTAPRTYQGMLEVTHFHLPIMGMVLLLLTHLLLFVPLRNGWKVVGVTIPFLSALMNEGAGWLVRFVHPGFAYVKIAAFLSLQGSFAVVLCLVLWGIWRRAPPPSAPEGQGNPRGAGGP